MKNLGIVVAQSEECLPLLNRLSQKESELRNLGYTITVIESGVGKLNAMQATYELLDKKVDSILNIGVAAGRGVLKVGDIVKVSHVLDGDFDISVFGHPRYYVPRVGNCIDVTKHGESIALRAFPCFSVSYFSGGHMSTNIESYLVDMEYYSIAFACKKLNIPNSSIKIISDTTHHQNHLQYERNLKRCCDLLADYVIEHLMVL